MSASTIHRAIGAADRPARGAVPVRSAVAALAASLGVATLAGAHPVIGPYFDTGPCDVHGPQSAVEELGRPPVFPTDERIEAFATFTQQAACPAHENPAIPNALVIMTNLSGRFWDNLFYVGDSGEPGAPLQTTFSNVDGEAFDLGGPPGRPGLAFRIDRTGTNRPLIFESLTPDEIFEPGETWQFIVDDYANVFGLGPAEFLSLGFANASIGVPTSSASIVQFVVPEPSAAALLLAGGGLAGLRRRHRS